MKTKMIGLSKEHEGSLLLKQAFVYHVLRMNQ